MKLDRARSRLGDPSARKQGPRAGGSPAQQRARGLAPLAFAALLGSACTGSIGASNPTGGSSGTNPTGGSSGANPTAGSSGTNPSGGSGGSSATGGSSGSGGSAPVATSTGGVMLRLLTQAEYRTSIQSLLGTLTTQLTLPADLSFAHYVSVGASKTTVSDMMAEAYETATRAAVAEVFGNAAALAKARGLRAAGRSQRRLRHHVHQKLWQECLPARPHRRRSSSSG